MKLGPRARMAAFALLYAASVVWGHSLASPPGHVSAVWPAAGVALAFLLIVGRRAWPVLWLAQLAVDCLFRADTTSLQSILLSLRTFAGITTGATLAAWIGAVAIRRFTAPGPLFRSFPSALRFLLFGGLLGPVCAATLGVLSLAAGDFVPWSRAAYTWLLWWCGDVVGVIVFAPLLLVWRNHLSSAALRPCVLAPLAPANLAILGLCLGVTAGVFVFSTAFVAFLVVPAFIAVVYRLAALGSVTTVPLIMLIARWGTAHGTGSFASLPRDVAPLLLGTFHVTLAVTGLLLSAVLTQRREAEDAFRANQRLLQAIIESTADGLLVIDRAGSVVTANRKFQQLWGISDAVLATGSDEELLGHITSLLKDPSTFFAKIKELYSDPDATSFDVIELADGRIFERYSQPERVGDSIRGRVWSFRDVTERRRTEDALRRSEARFRRLAEANMIGIVFSDLGGNINDANDYFLGLLGHDREDLLAGKLRWADLNPPEERWHTALVAEELKATGIAGPLEREYVCKNGRRVPALIGAALLERSGTEVAAFVLDISERRRAEQARDRLFLREQQARAQAEDATRQAAFLAEASAILAGSLDYETTLARIARLALPTLADSCLVDLCVGPRIQRVAAAHVDAAKQPLLDELRIHPSLEYDTQLPPLVALRTGQPYIVPDVSDEVLVTMDTDLRRVELVRALGIRSLLEVPMRVRGRCIGLLTLQSRTPGRYSSRDVPLAQELADRCAIAIENAQLYADAQTSIQARDDFIAIASHELRTPLTPLKMQLDILRKHLRSDALGPSPRSDRLVALLESSDRQMNRLSQLVENLLDVSRLGADRLELHLEELDLSQLGRDVVEHLASELARAGCAARVVAAAPVVGRWDRVRIAQVATNLLTNAVKFGRGRPIELRVSEEGCRARLSVEDHGIGVADADKARIFDRFERAASIKSFDGMGLGLYISRQIVLGHGGTIRVESELNAGATFIVELPLPAKESLPSSIARSSSGID